MTKSEYKNIECEVCGNSKFTNLNQKLRHGIKRDVFKCDDCGLVFLDPSSESPRAFYGKNYRSMYTPIPGKETNSQEIFDLYSPFQKDRINRLSSFLGKDKILLDIGCSAGHFLNAVKPFVRDVVGLEFNKADGEFIRKTQGLKVYDVPISETDLPKEYFDIITIFQTFEHVEKPNEFLEDVKQYLKPNGVLAIEAPNVEEALISLYGNEAYKEFSFKEVHLFYYNINTLSKLLGKHFDNKNIRLESIQRMNFLNHLYWIFTNSSQKGGPSDHMTKSKLPVFTDDDLVKNGLRKWLDETDESYKTFLNTSGIGESIWVVVEKKTE